MTAKREHAVEVSKVENYQSFEHQRDVAEADNTDVDDADDDDDILRSPARTTTVSTEGRQTDLNGRYRLHCASMLIHASKATFSMTTASSTTSTTSFILCALDSLLKQKMKRLLPFVLGLVRTAVV